MNEQNEPMDVNSDSGSSDSEDDELEQERLKRAEDLEKQLSDNKYLYNAHEELVSLYRQLGDLTSMRQAYQRFHEYFPLTPEIWLAWINVEKELASNGEEIKEVFKLFDDAVEDYLSVSLWVEYAQYSIGASDLETTRQILEKGLTAAGLHTADGSLLWDTLRELELAHLSLSVQGTDQWKDEVAKLVEIYRRQLSVPLLDMENTYKEWEEWLKQLPEDHKINTQPIEWGYKKALKILETYKPFEVKISGTTVENELLEIYREYIKNLKDPSTILCVYERAVAQLCLNPEIWLDYCSYVLKLGDLADKVSQRSLRNCPWSQELWCLRIRILDHLSKNDSAVIECFEQGISSLGDQSIDIWLTYLEYVYRNNPENKEKVNKNFEQALHQLYYRENDYLKVTKFYTRILAKQGNINEIRKLWKDIMKLPTKKTQYVLWIEVINLERQFGETPQVRNVFQRALNSVTDCPQFIGEEWLIFERENGSSSDVMKCLEKLKEVSKRVPVEPKGQKRKLEPEPEPEVKKPKYEPRVVRKQPILKDPTKTVFVSNLHTSVNERRLKKLFPNAVNIEVVMDKKGRSRCYGYVQFEMEEEVMTALARDRELMDGRPVFVSNCKPDRMERKSGFKYSNETEENKLFVKGLPFDRDEEGIKEIFKEFEPKDVRLVRRRDGQSKGIAYVEFKDPETAKKALRKTDQSQIGEHTISVAISAPPPKTASSKAAPPVRHARSKLQIPLVPTQIKVPINSNGDAPVQKSKTNEDFRNMLLK